MTEIKPGEPIVFNNYGELVYGRLVKLTAKMATIEVPAYGGGVYERKTKRSLVYPAPVAEVGASSPTDVEAGE